MTGFGKALRVFALSLLLVIPLLFCAAPALASAADDAVRIIAQYIQTLARELTLQKVLDQVGSLRWASVGKGGELKAATDYVSQVAQDTKTAAARWRVKQLVKQAILEQVMVKNLVDPKDGTQTENRVLNDAVCNLGAVGPDRYKNKNGCNKGAVKKIMGGDISIAISMLNNWNIPFHRANYKTEMDNLRNATAAEPFKLSDPNMRDAVLLTIAFYRMIGSDQKSWPQGAAPDTSSGVVDISGMSDFLLDRTGAFQALLEVIGDHIAPSSEDFPVLKNCMTDDANAIKNAKNVIPDEENYIQVPGKYCWPQIALNLGYTYRDWQVVEKLKNDNSAGMQQALFASSIARGIFERENGYATRVALAAVAGGQFNEPGGQYEKLNVRSVGTPGGKPEPPPPDPALLNEGKLTQ